MAALRPTYQAIVDAALAVTGAGSAWLLAGDGDEVRIAATAGATGDDVTIGRAVAMQGARAFALASGQPTALLPQPTDAANAGAGGAPGIPGSVLAVPCGDDDPVGVLEVAGRSDGGGFGFADIEALSGLAHVASVVLLEHDEARAEVATPGELAAEIEAYAQRNPARYANLAAMIEALLSIE